MGVVMSRHAVDAAVVKDNAAAVSRRRKDLTDLAPVPPSCSSPHQPSEIRSSHHVPASADAETIPEKRQSHRLEPARGVKTRSAAGTGKREEGQDVRPQQYSGTAGQVD